MGRLIDANMMVPDVEPMPDAQSSDATIGARPEIMPLEGTADLLGATQLNTPVPAGRSRAGRVATDEEKLTGRKRIAAWVTFGWTTPWSAYASKQKRPLVNSRSLAAIS